MSGFNLDRVAESLELLVRAGGGAPTDFDLVKQPKISKGLLPGCFWAWSELFCVRAGGWCRH